MITKKIFVISCFAILTIITSGLPQADAAEFLLRTNQQVYVTGDGLVVYGKALDNETLVVRLHDPTGRAIKIDTITADDEGFFREPVFEWPEPSKNLPFGTYRVEVTSNKEGTNTQSVDVIFAEGSQVDDTSTRVPIFHTLFTKMDSPSQVSINQTFRIFVQVTYDAALVNDEPASMLGTSHVHSGNITINLNESFQKLHEGLYYADVKLEQEGSYVIHSVAFYKGYIAHDSKVVTASASTISSIQESVDKLDNRLATVGEELDRLETQLYETKVTLNSTGSEITQSVEDARGSIGDDIASAKSAVVELQNASGQVNSIILPVLALISVIIALQISLFARIRRSYR